MPTVPILAALPETARARRAWFVDIWGVMHDGVRPFATAVDACREFRGSGGAVILVSNAPRPADSVAAQLARIGVDPGAYDAIVSSGDMSRALVAAHSGQTILHVGPERDLPLFAAIDVTIADGDDTAVAAIVCTGLTDDERERPEDYRERLAPLASRCIPMVFANPDLTVERGGRLIPCAGAVAAEYERLGGVVAYAGKPYAPIYDAAKTLAEAVKGSQLGTSDILAIGDGIRTDIDGAARYGIDSVFIASAVSLGDRRFDADTIALLFGNSPHPPIAAMSELVW